LFTGIVTEIGVVEQVSSQGGGVHFRIRAPRLVQELVPGASVGVNGVCQTVTRAGGDRFEFDSVAETLAKTNLSLLATGSSVNLEPALRLGDRVSGHLVSGHIDSTGVIRGRRAAGTDNVDFEIQIPDRLKAFVREKGSICLDGVSLTIKEARGPIVVVTVIPYTLRETILGAWRVGTLVNVEVDMIARYLVPRSG
jgi:riboflavin synthase